MSDSGNYGKTRVAAGIVGAADLTLGDRVEPVLLAQLRAGGGRFRGCAIRPAMMPTRSSATAGAASQPHLYRGRISAPAYRMPQRAGAQLRRVALSSAARRCRGPGAGLSGDAHCHGACRRGLGLRPYAGKSAEILTAWKRSMSDLAKCPNVVVKLGGMVNRGAGFDFHRAPRRALLGNDGGGVAPLCRDLHRVVRGEPLHVREQLPGRQDGRELRRAVERVQAHHERRLARRKLALFAGTAARVYRLAVAA